jgi:hypothetical protein
MLPQLLPIALAGPLQGAGKVAKPPKRAAPKVHHQAHKPGPKPHRVTRKPAHHPAPHKRATPKAKPHVEPKVKPAPRKPVVPKPRATVKKARPRLRSNSRLLQSKEPRVGFVIPGPGFWPQASCHRSHHPMYAFNRSKNGWR